MTVHVTVLTSRPNKKRQVYRVSFGQYHSVQVTLTKRELQQFIEVNREIIDNLNNPVGV